MAHVDPGRKPWDEDIDDRFYSSGSLSDDSPILSYSLPGLYPRARIKVHDPPQLRFSRICLFCSAMIMFCVLMYIPVYHKANYHIPKGIVAGWSIHTNRDTKLYVQPNNVTTIYEPKDVCNPNGKKNKLLLLIIVCSATQNVEIRNAIRETWGSHENYRKDKEIFHKVRDKYKNYDFSRDLYPNLSDIALNNLTNENTTYNVEVKTRNRIKRDISFNQLLPALAKVFNNVTLTKTDEVPEKRFEDDDEPLISEFDMNKEIGGQTEADAEIIDYENDYQSNIMRIPPKGNEEDATNPDLNKIIDLIKQSENFGKIKSLLEDSNPEFKVVFLLGLPDKDNKTVQKQIDDEVNKYGDIIQEGFIDSYNNLTLKSIMMLKWVTNRCNDSVRYVLKLDDDVYVNVPNLILNLKNRSQEFDKKAARGSIGPEYLLLGAVISGARPVLNAHNKWYSPKYMYGGKVYPRYLSGSGYAMSISTAHALYAAALRTRYFHLEDIYITGMCSLRAQPRIFPREDRQFSYVAAKRSNMACSAHSLVTMHRVSPLDMRATRAALLVPTQRDQCERIRLTQLRRDRLNQLKRKNKRTKAHL